jgi:hypothetical protein
MADKGHFIRIHGAKSSHLKKIRIKTHLNETALIHLLEDQLLGCDGVLMSHHVIMSLMFPRQQRIGVHHFR